MIKYFLFIFLILNSLPVFSLHLVLNVDVNKTLIAIDAAGNKSEEDILNELLADRIKAVWDASINTPISYSSYVAMQSTFKAKRLSLLHGFMGHIQEKNPSLYCEAKKTYDVAKNRLSGNKGRIFPSFYNLLKKLDEENISYTLVLRSYGSEVYSIAEEINKYYCPMINHKGFFKETDLYLDEKEVGSDLLTQYNLFKGKNHLAIRDDWNYWNKALNLSAFGKRYIINSDDPDTLVFFFDDNIATNDEAVNIVAPFDAKSGKSISILPLVKKGLAVKVNTLEAILDDCYFIKAVDAAIKDHQLKVNEKELKVH